MSTLKTHLIQKEQFAESRDRWNELAAGHPFHRWEWAFSWWESAEGQRDLAIAVVEQDGEWIAIAPWFISKTRFMGRVVQNLGNGAACSDYFSWLVRPGMESSAAESLATFVTDPNGPFASVSLFDLEGFSAEDHAMNFLLDAMEAQGMQVDRHEIAATWRSTLAPTWAEFNSELSKSFRRKTKKAQGRLDSPQINTLTVESPRDIEIHWKEFVRLHQMRRSSVGQAGCFADDSFERFLKTAVLRLAEHGLARLHFLYWQGQPFAVDLEFSDDDEVLMYQTGMDPALSNEEPGHTLFTWAIQRAIENGKSTFDFLRGDEPYKKRWNANRIPLYRVHIVPRKLSSRLRHGIWAKGKTIKSWAQQRLTAQEQTTS